MFDPLESRRVLALIGEGSAAALGELNGMAARLGLATPQTDAATVVRRMRTAALDARPVLWVITGLGYLYCVDCAARGELGGRPIRLGDACFGSDNCDRCGKAVGESASGELVA